MASIGAKEITTDRQDIIHGDVVEEIEIEDVAADVVVVILGTDRIMNIQIILQTTDR